MDADTEEKVTRTSKISKDESQKPLIDNKSRGRGFKSRGRGGRMSRGGMRGGRGMMKGFGPPGYGRGQAKDGILNGFAPMRAMRRMRPYPDLRGHRGRGGPMGMGPPPPPPPSMHLRGPFPPMPRHGPPPPPPLGHPGFRGCPPHSRGCGMLPPGPPRHFHPRSPRGGAHSTVNIPGPRNPGPPLHLSFISSVKPEVWHFT
ncbi:histidine-rich glycoprotein isoform X1 [Sander lucioperca]|uniref:histidine-rich glycoprotein isoform X1 n=1 Tax=Sander lucioperca TaxID=283035 RepID=UPI00125D4E3F|nr:histidine-rich glycoprotein isoform X1 [Sander lucioperca]